LAPNRGDIIRLQIEQEANKSPETLFPEKSLRKSVVGYLVSVEKHENEWKIRKIIPLQNAIIK
jgi:hypothetical protein